MPRLRYSVLVAFVVLTLVLLSLRIEIVGSSSSKIVNHGSSSWKESKSRGGLEQAMSAAKYPPVSPLLFDHGTPPAPFAAVSLTVSYPSIIRPDAIITTTDSIGPPSSTRGESSFSLASTTIAIYSAPQTRPTGSPTPGNSTRGKTSNALTQEEFEKEHNAIAS
jgi:hypothetical protein